MYSETINIQTNLSVEEPNECTCNAIEDAENEKDLYGPFDSVEDLMQALNA